MNLASRPATENLEARLAEELEERTEFCDWVSICYSCCHTTTTCTPNPSGPSTCSTT
jgi:hypothetical protein